MGDYVSDGFDVRRLKGYFLLCAGGTHRMLNRDKTSETKADALGIFPFVKLIYMLDLKLIILMTNPALVLGSV